MRLSIAASGDRTPQTAAALGIALENWATLAGLILIAALLVNRQYNGQSIAFMSGTQENLDVRSAGDGDAIEILEKILPKSGGCCGGIGKLGTATC